jgi:hypothetical protein
MQSLVSCPDCGVPAEITQSFRLPSTDGPVDHIVLHCAAGHHFRMAADRLPALQPQPQAAQRIAVCRPAVLLTAGLMAAIPPSPAGRRRSGQ